MISISDVTKLLLELTKVLAYHDIDLPAEIRDAILFSAPPVYRPVENTPRPAILPSRRAGMPTSPMQPDEVAKFLAGLAAVKTWSALVKHVGADVSPPISKSKSRKKKGRGRDDK